VSEKAVRGSRARVDDQGDIHVDLVGLLRDLVSAAQLFQSAAGTRSRLTPTELAVLGLLRTGPRIAGQLAEATQLTTGAITRVLDGLEERGYVTRGADPDDRRRVVVTAVAERLAAVDDLFTAMGEAASAVQRTFSGPEQDAVARYLATISEVLREQTVLLREGAAMAAGPVTLGAPLGMATAARLHLAGGLRQLEIRAGGEGFPPDSLYEGTFAGAAPTSQVAVHPDETQVWVRFGRHRLAWRGFTRTSTLTLSPRVGWAIEARGGADRLAVDLVGLWMRSFSLTGGASDLRLRLGQPKLATRISLTAGANRLRLERPAGVPVDLRLRGGVNNVVVDGVRQGPMGNWSLSGGNRPGDYYELVITGGVNDLEIAPLS
jgi:DNA-binding MarR family transcriptional regulator